MALLNNSPKQYYDGNDFGNYQFVSLKDIINQFIHVYVGEDKIISKAKRTDVAFHAQRALAELSFDTFKSCKAQEITVPASLQMILPHDYVNYTKISWVDSAGIKRLLYPASKTSNPSDNPLQDSNGDFKLQATGKASANGSAISIFSPEHRILVGMVVEGPLDLKARVIKVIHTPTKSLVTLGVDDGTLYPYYWPLVAFPHDILSGVFTFSNLDGSLVLPQVFNFNVSGFTLDPTGYDMVAASPADIADIKPGMIANFSVFPLGAIVEAVDTVTGTVTVSNIAAANVGGTGNFVSHEGYLSKIGEYKDTDTWSSYKSGQSNVVNHQSFHHHNHHDHESLNKRYGLDPQRAQANGSFYIDHINGKIHFSSNISGKTVILDYISDSLGTDGEMQVHKFAEEAMYKWLSHAILSGKANIPEYQVNRLKKERFAAIRTAKLRLSNLKLEELTQILRGKSKWIKH